MTFSRTFPDGFLFGAATASYQIEGAVKEDGRGQSIWDTFSATPGKTFDGDTGEVACDHYHRVPEDVALMKELGLDAYRFSVAWPRIQADGTGPANPLGLAFYDRLVDELLGAGIRPVVTLYHWDLPQALEDRGGWRDREIAGHFAEYAGLVVDALGDRVRNWTTLNEPWCSAFLGHTIGAHAPGHQDPVEGLLAAHHLMLAHGTAVPVIRERCADAEVSITLNPSQVHGPEDASEADLDAVRRTDNALNGVFFGPLFHGAYPDGYLDDVAHLTDGSFVHDGDLETISARLDNLGVNNYFPARVRATPDGVEPTGNTHLLPGCERVDEIPAREPTTAMGWEQSPESHRMILERSGRESGLPVYVTENGSAWDDVVDADGAVHDPERTNYLVEHLGAVLDAVEGGTDVRGYFAWSLMDNFEWAYGYDKRFGIVHVDYDTQQRTVKDSGREYQRILAARHDG